MAYAAGWFIAIVLALAFVGIAIVWVGLIRIFARTVFNSGRPFWAPVGSEMFSENYFTQVVDRPATTLVGVSFKDTIPVCASCRETLPSRPPVYRHFDCRCGLRMRRVRVNTEDFADEVWCWRPVPQDAVAAV